MEIQTKLDIMAIKKQFQLDIKQMNHGSFGTIPLQVREKRIEWLDKIERHCDNYMVEALEKTLDDSIKPLAEYIGSDYKNVVFIPNTMTGINIIFQTLGLKQGDLVLYSEISYQANKILLKYMKEEKGIILLELPYTPMTNEEIISQYEKIITKQNGLKKPIKLALVDAISSVPAIIMPWERITKILSENSIISLIDGAHSFGQLKINLSNTDPDFFITNVHKWGYSYRPTALLYVSPKYQDKGLHNLVITYGFEMNEFRYKFLWPGTSDLSAWFSANEGLIFRQSLGEQNVVDYINELSLKAGKLLAKKFDTKILNREEYQIGFMNNVQLPTYFKITELLRRKFEYKFFLFSGFRIKIFQFIDLWWIRLSAQIYLDLNDFDKLGDEILKYIPLFINELIEN